MENVGQFANPYPAYAKWRRETPVFQKEDGTWYVTRYRDIKMVLSDKRFVRRPPENGNYISSEKGSSLLNDFLSKWAIFNDPPEHTNIRAYLKNLFLPQFIREKRAIIDEVSKELLSNIFNKTTFDFMKEFAFPLPVIVLNKLLGTEIPVPKVREWSLTVSSFLDHGSPEDFEKLIPVMLEIKDFFTDFVERAHYSEKTWVGLLNKLKTDYGFTTQDVVSMCVFLFMTGHETTQLAFGLGALALLKHPQQLKLVLENPKLIPAMVEEVLRYECPLIKISRWTTQDIQFDNVIVPANNLVVAIMNSGNRDPEKFSNPDEFDIFRPNNNQHITFGYSFHHCLGALLSRIELQVGLGNIISYLDKFSFKDEDIVWLDNSSLRYVYSFPMKNNLC